MKAGTTFMKWQERIELNPAVLNGKPIIKGTRLAVELVVELVANGWTEATIIENYPTLTKDDVRACLQYASATLRAEKVYPLKA
jgi:uncharacterized protein (DUF433 family)